MKLSLNWIKQYTDVDMPVDELVEKIGAQLGEVESVENLMPKYEGAVIVKVVSVEDHPNADRLHICRVDDGGVVKDAERGEDSLVQVVCGATNVRADMLAIWLPPGATVPDSYARQPFVLEARELRGVISNGMLASRRELALGDEHDGILEIDADEWSPNQKDIKPGANFAKVFGLDDVIIDIENKMFTHRPDLFGELGLAREVAGINQQKFVSPEWYAKAGAFPAGSGLELEVVNEAPELVPRLTVLAVKDVAVKPSPLWLQCQLIAVGQKPINNIVDVTNYIMLLTGQPTHAYDYDKLRGHQLVARMAKPGEKITLLNHKEYQLDQADIVIADGEGPIGLAGVMGGGDSEVSDDTKNIVLESANFDMYAVRRSSMRHGVFTDALTRFNKGQSPLQTDHVLSLLIQSVFDVAGGEVASQVYDENSVQGRDWVHPPVPVEAGFINARLGLELAAEEMKQLLENVEMQVEFMPGYGRSSHGDAAQGAREERTEPYGQYGEGAPEGATKRDAPNNGRVSGSAGKQAVMLRVSAPFWRTDIETREDVVEEVGRLYGYDKLPLELPSRTIQPVTKDAMFELKQRLRQALATSGANEVLTYSFVHGNLLEKAGQHPAKAFRVANALSPDLQYYRLSLTPSLLDKIHPNIKAGYDRFAIFELGKGHNLDQIADDGLPEEYEMLDYVYAAADKLASAGAAYYQALKAMDRLLASLGIEYELRSMDKAEPYEVAKPYDHTRSAQVWTTGGLPLGMVGEYKTSVRRNFKLPAHTAGFGLGVSQLLQASQGQMAQYVALSKFPPVRQDLTLKVPADTLFNDLHNAVTTALHEHAPQSTRSHLETLSVYQPEGESTKNISFRITLTADNRTLKEQEATATVEAVAEAARTATSAEKV